jgi:DNA-binding transcriptional regulator YiaG
MAICGEKMKPFPWMCGTCRQKSVYAEILDNYSETIVHDMIPYKISIDNLDVMKCRNCGETIFIDDSNERVSDALRVAAGLLSPSEIQTQREEFGLTHQQLADFLQISEASLKRYELGHQIQSRCIDRFLRVFFSSSQARHRLGFKQV